jgi:hypothetical protein
MTIEHVTPEERIERRLVVARDRFLRVVDALEGQRQHAVEFERKVRAGLPHVAAVGAGVVALAVAGVLGARAIARARTPRWRLALRAASAEVEKARRPPPPKGPTAGSALRQVCFAVLTFAASELGKRGVRALLDARKGSVVRG